MKKVVARDLVAQVCPMKTVLTRDFTKRFATLSHQPLQVSKRGRVVGTWMPATKPPPPLDVMKRLKRTFKHKLPFTGAELLKESNAR